MDSRTIVAIVLASVLALLVLSYLAWRLARRSVRVAARAVRKVPSPDGAPPWELDGRLLPSVLVDPVRTLASVVEVLRPALLPSLAPDGTITLVFSDLEDSTRLNVELGDERFAELLADHEATARRLAREHRGRLVKSVGDGLMLAFKQPHRAVAFAVAFRSAVGDQLDGVTTSSVRIGIHTGEARSQHGDYIGANVAFAARVSAAARAGEVLVSDPVRARVDGDRLGVRFRRGRRHRLKGIPGRHPLHPVDADTAA